MTAPSAHIGIDLAWGAKNRTGLAAVGADGRLLASGSATTDDEILAWVSDHADALGVVAIDAPLVVTNASGRRRCESLIQEHFGRYDAYAHSTNLGKPEFNPPRGAVLAERLGLPLDPDGPRSGVAIEVYPHPAMVGLWELDLILKYKHKTKYPFDFRKREFGRLLELLKREPTLRVSELPRWGELRTIVATATKHGDLNRIEDEVDGIVCAWLAWLWATDDERLEVYGDLADGYIVAPPKPLHDPRPRSERMAPTRAARLPVTGTPRFAEDEQAGSEHYVAIATYTARPETAEQVAALLPQLAAASRAEPGNISYTVARDLERSHVFTIVEVYEGADAFQAHRDSTHFAEIGRAQIIPLLESRVVVVYDGAGVIG